MVVTPRCLLLSIVLLALPAQRVQAQIHAAAGVEHFEWSEDTRPRVEESGPRGSLSLGWTLPGSGPVRPGMQATLYGGFVRYRGSLLFEPSTPANGTTSYLGTTQEAFLRVRATEAVDVLGGVGFDLWLRRLSADQREDFTVGFARLGAEAKLGPKREWLLGAGLKFPFSASEDAHLDLLGFDQNPRLEPRGEVSGFGQLGYRFRSGWSLVGHLDGFQFKASPPVTVTRGGGTVGTIFQPRSDLRVLGLELVRHF